MTARNPPSNSTTQTSKGGWSPATKAQASMAPLYRGWSPERRMEAAVKLVLESENGPAHLKISQSEAARQCGVTRPKLNQRIQEIRKKLAAQHERSDKAMAERTAGPLDDQTRRFPTFQEFDKLYFSQMRCLDHGVYHGLAPAHLEIMDKVTDPTARRLLINFPPDHSKSTIATIKSTVYELAKDPNHQTLVICAGQDLARKFLRAAKNYLEDERLYEDSPRNLIEDYGPFRGDGDWRADYIYVIGRQGANKDPSIEARGYRGNIYGGRFHRLIFDDLADRKNQANPLLVEEMFKWCTTEAASRVGPDFGRLIFVGTRIRPGDVYSKLLDLPAYEVLRYPCILDEESQTTLWPDHVSYEAACRIRGGMSPEDWELVYQNVESMGANASFPPEIVEAAHDGGRSIGHTEPEWALVAGLDPAGAGAQAGYTAMVLMGVDLKSGKRHLVDLVNIRALKAPQLRDQILAWADQYPRLRELRVEVNGLQGQLFQYNEELNAHLTNRGIRIAPHITHGHNKWDADFGVESCAPLFYNHMISTPWADLVSRNKFGELDKQLKEFPMGQPNDLVMALWFAELGCREIFQRETMPMFSPRLKVPNRLRRKRGVIDFSERSLRRPTASEERGGHEYEAVKPIPFANLDARSF